MDEIADFYLSLAAKLYANNLSLDGVNYSSREALIEAFHNDPKSPNKGKEFYQNVRKAMEYLKELKKTAITDRLSPKN